MKVPSGFAARAFESADGVPRETIALLLNRLMPRTEVKTRRAEPDAPSAEPRTAVQPRAFNAPVRRRRRVTVSYRLSAQIVITAKGRRKASRVRDTDAWRNMKTLTECPTVRDAVYAGLNNSDLKYAVDNGTIIIDEGE